MSNNDEPRLSVRYKKSDGYFKKFEEFAKEYKSTAEAFRDILKKFFDNINGKDNEIDIVYKRLNKVTEGLDNNGNYLILVYETLIKFIKYYLTFGDNNIELSKKETMQKINRGKVKYNDLDNSLKKILQRKGLLGIK